jgi:putative cell wall-binding protein
VKRNTAVIASAAALVLVASGGAAAAAGAAGAGHLPQRLAPGQVAEGTLASAEVGKATLRLSGGDRFETAAEVSRANWDYETTAVVYLASGENYPDALAMGASTFGAGPLLLTRRDALPQATVEELERLAPCMVVVVGGTAAVSDAVAQQADGFTDPESCEF